MAMELANWNEGRMVDLSFMFFRVFGVWFRNEPNQRRDAWMRFQYLGDAEG
jgi:hypothetical protein